MDYGAQPPEINSGRMYSGVGSGPLMASAAAYQALAAELGTAATSIIGTLDALAAASWLGPSSMSMLSAAMPYVTWLLSHAAQAEQRALLHGQSVNAFETAFASVIPPAQIAENRTELATLIATNFMGVNTPAIAANEAEYSEFWAQDASTLYGFAGQAAAITGAMVPFMPPAMSTDPAGLAAQAAAVGESTGQSAGTAGSTVGDTVGQMSGMGSGMGSVMGMAPQAMSAIPQALQSLSGMGGLSSAGQLLSPFMSMFGSTGAPPAVSAGSWASAFRPTGGGSAVTASMGRGMGIPSVTAISDGSKTARLSVPSTWPGAVERGIIKEEAAVAAPITEEEGVTPMAATPRGGMMPAALAGNQSSSSQQPANNRKYLNRPRVVSYWP